MRNAADDDSVDEESDDAGFDEEGGDDETAMTPCLRCGAMIYEDAERCPTCGEYQSEEEKHASQPRWVLIAVVVCILLIVIVWIVGHL